MERGRKNAKEGRDRQYMWEGPVEGCWHRPVIPVETVRQRGGTDGWRRRLGGGGGVFGGGLWVSNKQAEVYEGKSILQPFSIVKNSLAASPSYTPTVRNIRAAPF